MSANEDNDDGVPVDAEARSSLVFSRLERKIGKAKKQGMLKRANNLQEKLDALIAEQQPEEEEEEEEEEDAQEFNDEDHRDVEHRDKKKRSEEDEKLKVFCSRLPDNFHDKDLKAALSSFGPVKEATVCREKPSEDKAELIEAEHEGKIPTSLKYGFVIFESVESAEAALAVGVIKRKAGKTKAKKNTPAKKIIPFAIKIGVPISKRDMPEGSVGVCGLWQRGICPYTDCKFEHTGPGSRAPEAGSGKKKCFVYKKKGICPKGADCPFSHDFFVTAPSEADTEDASAKNKPIVFAVPRTDKEKPCLTFRKKGRCPKGDDCNFSHDAKIVKRKKPIDPAAEKRAAKKLKKQSAKDRQGKILLD